MTNWQTLFLIVLATGAAISTWMVISRMPPERQVQQALLMIVTYTCAYLFARFYYVVFEASALPQNFFEAVDFQNGGLSAFGAIWGALIGFLLACGVQQRKPAPTLDEIAPALFSMAAFVCAARWLVDADLYRTYPDSMAAFLPRFILPVAYIKPPDVLLLATVVMAAAGWALEHYHHTFKTAGLKGNIAFTILVIFTAAMESIYGFLRLHPAYPYFVLTVCMLPLVSWILWFALGRKAEDR